MSFPSHTVDVVDARRLVIPALGALLALFASMYLVAFDQGTLASLATDRLLESGGVLHEYFHDARHLLGVPCH
jgi:hypothetical protein